MPAGLGTGFLSSDYFVTKNKIELWRRHLPIDVAERDIWVIKPIFVSEHIEW